MKKCVIMFMMFICMLLLAAAINKYEMVQKTTSNIVSNHSVESQNGHNKSK